MYGGIERKMQRTGMQKEPLEAKSGHPTIEFRVSILVITGNRMARMPCVDPNLVGAPRDELDFHQARIFVERLRREETQSVFTGSVDLYHSLSGTQDIFKQGCLDFPTPPAALHKRQIALVHPSIPHRFMEGAQRAAFLGDDKTP